MRLRALAAPSILLAVGAVGVAALPVPDELALATPAPVVPLDPPRAPTDDLDCARCHSAVADEWAAGAHAIAWDDVHYQHAIADRKRPELCAGCHVPQPVLAAGEPARRVRAREAADESLHHGVSCTSCHAGPDGAVLGPRGTPTDAHASVASPFMTPERSSELCAACHRTNIGPVIGIAKDYEASKQIERGRTCVGCHMAPVERRWADGEDVPERLGRSHAFQTPRDPAFLRRAFGVELLADGSAVAVTNRTGHRVPGLVGREIRFRALDADGNEVGSLTLDARTYLPVDDRVLVQLSAPVAPGGPGTPVRLVGDHVDPRVPDPIRFLEETLSGDGTGD